MGEDISNEQALKSFLYDISYLDELAPWADKFNIFDVLKISRAELRHSNMLSWLLSPNESHGFGDSVLRNIIQILIENNDLESIDVFKTLLMDLSTFRILREWKNIDILAISETEKFLVCIENKVGSQEHSNQLKRYH
ncbi:PD-(D/E)XK nuclease family protein, partial [Christensenellaceae bacterium OttesenSCG-928-K19]|nr:PD-(D/E)XK nuclease family protein [Christensenellaceae bacterium OttesenSCG-928-K19]